MIFSIYEVILMLSLCSLLGAFCGLFSYFLDYTFWPGSIFGFYLPWLAKKFVRPSVPMLDTTLVDLASEKPWFKLLGGCCVCLNVWVCMVSFTAMCLFTWLPWWGFIPYLVTSSALLRRLVGAH